MPFEFLTDEHLHRYGQYWRDPTPDELDADFHLTPHLHALLADRRHAHTRLGFALQYCSLKYLCAFPNLDRTPDVVLHHLAAQLALPPTNLRALLVRYLVQPETRALHARQIRAALGYRDFTDVDALHLLRALHARLTLADERPLLLFDFCTQCLVQRHVVLPGPHRLARLVTRVRQHVAGRQHHHLAARLTLAQRETLDALLVVPAGSRFTPLERLRRPALPPTVGGLLAALTRLGDVRALGVGNIDLGDVPASRLAALSRFALGAWGPALARLPTARRHATLLATAQHLERQATDDVLDLFDALMHGLALRGQRRHRTARLRALRDLDDSALVLRDVARLVLDADVPSADVRAQILARLPRDRVQGAVDTVTALAGGPPDEVQHWTSAARTVTRFLARLLPALNWDGTPSAASLLDAVRFTATALRMPRPDWRSGPRAFVPRAWSRAVFPETGGLPDRAMYLLCLAHRLHVALKGREVFVARSFTHGDPRAQLLQGNVWEERRVDVCRALNWSPQPPGEVQRLAAELDADYCRTLEVLAASGVTVQDVDGDVRVSVPPLPAETRSVEVEGLEAQITERLPAVDLSEVLLEIEGWTGFASELVPDDLERTPDLAVSLCAVLLAQACNIGLKAVSREGHAALNLGRLSWVQQHYVRADALLRANARLVERHLALPITKAWGEGEVVSADGLRFVVPMKNVRGRPNSRYFGSGRGVTLYAYTSDTYVGLHGLVIPGTLRDSLFILAGLLEQQTGVEPREIMSDTAGYSDVVFGLFRLLGYRFSPRLADVGGTRFWRLDRTADYGELDKVARHRVDTALIARHWDDLLRLAGSLKLGTVGARDVMRVLAAGGSLSGLGKAVTELGRIAKTQYLLAYIGDEGYRRRIHTQLNRGESRGKLARAICYGGRGELRERYREGLEDQLGALGVVVNAVTLWNARYIGAALGWLREMGEVPDEGLVAHVSPLRFGHISMLGRFGFELPEDVAAGGMRALRDPWMRGG